MIARTKALIKHPLFSGSALMMGGGMVVNGINYLYHLIMGRLMGPEVYGGLAAIFSLLYIVSIVPISSSFAIVKFISAAKTSLSRANYYYTFKKYFLYLAIVSMIVMISLAPYLSSFLHLNDPLMVMYVGPVLFFTLITLVNQSALQGILKFFGVVGPNFVAGLMKLVLGVGAVLLGYSLNGVIGVIVISAALAYLHSVFLIKDKFSNKNVKLVSIKPFIKYSIPVLVQALAFTAFFTVDLILVKHFLPSYEAGLYAALSTLGKIIFFASAPITQTMFPIVSGRHSKGESYIKVFFASFVITLAVSVAIVLFYWLFPNVAIGVLYGKDYLAASSELVWMGVFMAVYAVCYLLVNFLLSIGKTRIVLLPLIAVLLQVIGIWRIHGNILEVIQVSLVAMVIMFLGLSVYLGYNYARHGKN